MGFNYRSVPAFAAFTTLIISMTSPVFAASAAPPEEWRYFGGNIGFDRYSSLNLINPTNVAGLKVLWTRPAVAAELLADYPDLSAGNYFRSTPIMVNGVLYGSDGVGLVEAFDPATGKTIWVQQPFSNAPADLVGQSLRGVAYWSDARESRIISVRGEYLYALDARTGKTIPGFGQGGRVSLHRPNRENAQFRMSGGPLVIGDIVVVGGEGSEERVNDYGDQKSGTPETVRAFDVRSGKLLWSFSPRPAPEDPASKTWENGAAQIAGAMGAYGTLSADEELGYVYVPFSAPNPPVWGGWRAGNNEYGDSLVALEAKTGKKVWSFQMVHHDLWDWDLSSPPVLGDITVNGHLIKAVMQTGKNALLFTLDRKTGVPVWPVEERPVPQSTVPGEHSAATQPFPTKPAPLDRVGVTPEDLIDFTPELHRGALEILNHYVYGPMYTPPSVYGAGGKRGTLTLPGTDGGGNWNAGAFDPQTGRYYAMTVTVPAAYALAKPKAPDATVDYTGSEKFAFVVWGPHGLPLTKPPYGRITSVDMNRGEFDWVIANGEGPRNHPLLKELNLPSLGIQGRAALLVTGSLLFAGEGSDAVYLGAQTKGFGHSFRAYDKKTGKVLATVHLPAGTTGAPITYAVGGKQFVVVAIGGSDHSPEWVALGVQ